MLITFQKELVAVVTGAGALIEMLLAVVADAADGFEGSAGSHLRDWPLHAALPSRPANCSIIAPDLATLVASWAGIPEPIKAAIRALVHSATK